MTLEQRGSAVLHVCLETVGQLELWLQEAQRSLVAGGAAAGATTMQDSVEQQLLTCQDMFLEIERRVSSLTALGPAAEQQDEAAELLSSKLELLKANLVSFQQLLQDRQGEERTLTHTETQGQVQAMCRSRNQFKEYM